MTLPAGANALIWELCTPHTPACSPEHAESKAQMALHAAQRSSVVDAQETAAYCRAADAQAAEAAERDAAAVRLQCIAWGPF